MASAQSRASEHFTFVGHHPSMRANGGRRRRFQASHKDEDAAGMATRPSCGVADCLADTPNEHASKQTDTRREESDRCNLSSAIADDDNEVRVRHFTFARSSDQQHVPTAKAAGGRRRFVTSASSLVQDDRRGGRRSLESPKRAHEEPHRGLRPPPPHVLITHVGATLRHDTNATTHGRVPLERLPCGRYS